MYKLYVATAETDKPIYKESDSKKELVEAYKSIREQYDIISAVLVDENGNNLNESLCKWGIKKYEKI